MKKTYWLYIIGAIVGAIGGLLYWHFVGCPNGTCPISSSPILSTIFGAVIGLLVFSMFKREK